MTRPGLAGPLPAATSCVTSKVSPPWLMVVELTVAGFFLVAVFKFGSAKTTMEEEREQDLFGGDSDGSVDDDDFAPGDAEDLTPSLAEPGSDVPGGERKEEEPAVPAVVAPLLRSASAQGKQLFLQGMEGAASAESAAVSFGNKEAGIEEGKVEAPGQGALISEMPRATPADIGTKTTVLPAWPEVRPGRAENGPFARIAATKYIKLANEVYPKMWAETGIRSIKEFAERWDAGFKYQVSETASSLTCSVLVQHNEGLLVCLFASSMLPGRLL